MKMFGMGEGQRLDPTGIRNACIVLLLGVLQVIWAVNYGDNFACKMLGKSVFLGYSTGLIRISGFISGFIAVVGFITAGNDRMVYGQLILGLVNLLLLDMSFLLHLGMGIVGGLIPFIGTVMLLVAVEKRRRLMESSEEKSTAGIQVYTGSMLLLVLVMPLGYYLSKMLLIYGHSFFVQKAEAVLGSILFAATVIVGGMGFLFCEGKKNRDLIKAAVSVHLLIYIVALIASVCLYISMDQIQPLICTGILVAGIGANVAGIMQWSPAGGGEE